MLILSLDSFIATDAHFGPHLHLLSFISGPALIDTSTQNQIKAPQLLRQKWLATAITKFTKAGPHGLANPCSVIRIIGHSAPPLPSTYILNRGPYIMYYIHCLVYEGCLIRDRYLRLVKILENISDED